MRYLKAFVLAVFILALPAQAQESPTQTVITVPSAALVSLELMTGWPGFNLYSLRSEYQQDRFGFVLSGSYTAAGPYVSLAGRVYLPIPVPVPTFASLGGGYFAGGPVYYGTVGAHLPGEAIGLNNFRLSLEAGASAVTGLGATQILPYVSLSFGYTFLIEHDPVEPRLAQTFTEGGAVCVPRPPTEEELTAAFGREVARFLARAQVTYAGTYTDLRYSYDITSVSMSGNSGSVGASYSGSVRTIIGGATESASGTISASFVWTGCSWSLTSYDFTS